MSRNNMRLAAIGAGVAVAAAGLFVLGSGSAPAKGTGPSRGRTPAHPSHRGLAEAPARPAGAVVARPAAAAHAPASAAQGETEVTRRARDLFQRLQKAAGRPATLPEDLRRDLLAFLAEGEESRAALFRMAWDPGAPRMVLGHIKLTLLNLEDAGSRDLFLASLDSYDPQAGLKTELAGKARDPSLLAAELRAMPSGEPKVQRLQMLPKEILRNDAMKEMLLEAAREDVDATVRSTAYFRAAEAAYPEATAILVAAASDDGRDVRERQMAAYALTVHPVKPSADDLLRLWDGSPAEVRVHLLQSLAQAGPNARVDSVLLETLATNPDEKFRKQAANAIGMRLYRLPADAARELGSRTAEILKGMTEETTATALRSLGGVVVDNAQLREAVADLHRTAPRGGAIQIAIASSPALRMAVGM